MAAIKPFTEDLPEPAVRTAEAKPQLSDLGVISELPPLNVSHANLTRTLWIRKALEDLLATRDFEIKQDAKGLYMIAVRPMLPKDGIPWFVGIGEHGNYRLYGDNGKMHCPTWDLPAGAPICGGSCPGATVGQSVVELAIRKKALAAMPPPPGSDVKLNINEEACICEMCISGDTRILVRGEGMIPIADLVGAGDIEVWSGKAWRWTRAVFTRRRRPAPRRWSSCLAKTRPTSAASRAPTSGSVLGTRR